MVVPGRPMSPGSFQESRLLPCPTFARVAFATRAPADSSQKKRDANAMRAPADSSQKKRDANATRAPADSSQKKRDENANRAPAGPSQEKENPAHFRHGKGRIRILLVAEALSLVWLLLLPAAFLALLALGFFFGLLLPRDFQVSRTLQLQKSMEEVFRVIRDFPSQTSWRKDLVQVESLPPRKGKQVWRETYRGGKTWTLETTVETPPALLQRTLLDQGGAPLGTWDFQLSPSPEGCWVTLTERIRIPNPLSRFLGRYVLPRARRVEGFLRDLAESFGEKPVLE